MRQLLSTCFCLLTQVAPGQSSKPLLLSSSNTALFEQLTAGLEASRLYQLYRADLKLKQVRRNRHEPAIKDSVLLAITPTDHLELFKNRYNTLLLGATFTSTKVSFGGLKIGVTKEVFCRTLHLSPTYTTYAFTDGMENFVQLTCTFASGKLRRVEYNYLINPDSID
ncbi:hypothetical protein [Hymenobacter sp. BT559]|uniref:hypothetical protein n=1 Tax=Hymenobacter sp. BT559 TaxID=2795729 RepID=UPI0018EE1BBB|nr:hypothetical protein [Hymenobacter sp. BT559]MBJ6143853.1 hypothetical protein [Hymenobacter sp. BT559]